MSHPPGGDERRRACAVCGRILNLYVSPEGQRSWLHTYADLPEDHPAVPVDLGDGIHTRPRCDFCDSEQPTWELPARSFTLPGLTLPGPTMPGPTMPGPTLASPDLGLISGPVENASHDNWAACDRCAYLVEGHQWTALRRRALTAWLHHVDDPAQQAAMDRRLGQLYRQLRRHITGPVRRVQPDTHR